ncbi:toxin-antitoxin system YwqK family antitoxin [Tenacibaculum agarivorans]|uniref:toxin-antitoxin system YwqK family antitoxin n=1 Tax=Tenacibaculum agarivorans TaxID=1908389 RepID=UPI00094BAF7E|nr:hypothetical protein [Tenacibaculum agarivorans]
MYKSFAFCILLFVFSWNCQTKKVKEKEIKAIESKHEIRKEYWENDTLASEGIYINGKANGDMKWYHPNGKLAGEGPMVDDKREGLWKVYESEFGKLSAEGYFVKGIKHGTWKIFRENGALWKEQLWEHNTLIKNTGKDNNVNHLHNK